VGLAVDGTGYGEDGTIWGGECLFVDTATLERRRLGHLAPVLLPGGEAAVLEPWRMAQSYLHAIGLTAPGRRPWPWLELKDVDRGPASRFLAQMLAKRINCPVTTSCGRLFDAVAGLLGLCEAVAYEGQAAILLEKIQDPGETRAYPCPLVLPEGGPAVLDTLALFRSVYDDVEAGVPAGVVSRRFHLGLCRGLAGLALEGCRQTGAGAVALSGGVMQNLTMSLELPRAIEALGFVPLSHAQVPPNDGCISLGQAFFGLQALRLGAAGLREPG
jgi:hydrogenase maturation protein HypF